MTENSAVMKRSTSAALKTFGWGCVVSMVLAFIVAVAGGGVLGFIAIFVIGAFLSTGLAAVVMFLAS